MKTEDRRKKDVKYQNQQREEAKKKGKCIYCHKRKPHPKDSSFCKKCREFSRKRVREYQKRLKQKRLKAKVCITCGSDKLFNKNLCKECRDRRCGQYRGRYVEKQRAYGQKIKLQVFTAYGGAKCNCPGCKVVEPSFLSIDHTDNDGAEHRRKIGASGQGLYYWLIKNGFPKGFQVLCINCNFGKRLTGKCPLHGKSHTGE